MKPNISRSEQFIRILAGVMLVAAGFVLWQVKLFWPGIITALVGAAGLVTGSISFSPFYKIFGIHPARCTSSKEVIMAKDPVCGMKVDEKTAPAKSDYKGTTYYFCAPACKKAFDAHPEQYVKKGG